MSAIELRSLKIAKPIAALCFLSAISTMFTPAHGQVESYFEPVEKMMSPQFKDEKERVEYVIKSMERVQAAACRYASHHKGELPKKVDNAFMSYMIMGECDDKTFSTFSIPFNPYSGKRQNVINGKIADPDQCRNSPPQKMAPGSIEYSLSANGKDFTVRGGVGTGKALADPKNKKRTFVLSHDPLAQVRANMRTVQWAAESYKEENFKFPKAVDDGFKYFFPFGDYKKKKLGNPLPNPFTGKLEYPTFANMDVPFKARHKAPCAITAGGVEYCSSDQQSNYCIRGGDKNGKAIAGAGGANTTLVLAKDGDGSGFGNDSR